MKQSGRIPPEFLGLDPEEAEWRKCFRNKLDHLMRRNHMTNVALGKAIGATHVTILSYRSGKSIPNAYRITRIAKALGCTTGALLDFD